MSFRIRSDCRLCKSEKLTRVLDLADTPLANEFVATQGESQDKFPLFLVQCEMCGHVQLPVVVDPSRLFANYVYVSGTSASFVEHFRQYADDCIVRFSLGAGSNVVEIGSNDGTMLRAFKKRGMNVLGIDPAKKIADKANESGIRTIPKFFTHSLAESIREDIGPVKLVAANNVFAHADALDEIALGVKHLIRDGGHFVFEVSYLVSVIENTLFDTIYHEHLSYHTLEPLVDFFAGLGMSLFDAEKVDTHGGSIRCYVSANSGDAQSNRLKSLIAYEHDVMSSNPFAALRAQISEAGVKLRSFFAAARINNHKVVGYGAPAKLTTLMHQFGIGAEDIKYVVDDSPWKQGLFTPGSHIPVVSSDVMSGDDPDEVVIFAWNFADQIAKKIPNMAGRIVVPLPEYREI